MAATSPKGSYEPAGFKLRLGLKDVNLAIDAAAAPGRPFRPPNWSATRLNRGVAQGLGEKDWSALAEVAHSRAGLRR